MFHLITSVAHGFQRVTETVRLQFHLVDSSTINRGCKTIFLIAPIEETLEY